MIDRKYFTINLVIFNLPWDISDLRWNTNLEFIFTFVHSHDLLQTSLNIFKCCVSTHYWHNHGNHSDIRQWSERLICTFNKLIIKWICALFENVKIVWFIYSNLLDDNINYKNTRLNPVNLFLFHSFLLLPATFSYLVG